MCRTTRFSLRAPKSPDAPDSAQSEEEVDELSLIDHSEIMARLTLKQEVSASQASVQGLTGGEGEGEGLREGNLEACHRKTRPGLGLQVAAQAVGSVHLFCPGLVPGPSWVLTDPRQMEE